MTKFRVSALLCLVVLVAGYGYGQSFETPKYTNLPPTYLEYKGMKDEAAWYVKAFSDPLTVLKQDQDTVAKYLNLNSWDIRGILQQGAEGARLVVAKSLVSKAQYDPYFEAVMEVAQIKSDNKSFAVQATQVLVDTLRTYVMQYPNIKEPSKTILLARLDDSRMGVRYSAIIGLGYLANSPAPQDVVQALVKQLKEVNDEVITDAAATALGNLGDKSAIKPLMERFLTLPENVDTSTEPDEASTSPGMPASDQPLNQARLSIAIAVDKLAGLNLRFDGLIYKDDVLKRYESLNNWWDENKDSYQ